MLRSTTQESEAKTIDSKVNEKPTLPSVSLEGLDIIEIADHLNISISEAERQLKTKPFFLYPKDGLCGLL